VVPADEQVSVSLLGHPLRASKVILPRPIRTLGLAARVELEHNARDLAPIRALRLCIKETRVQDEVPLSYGVSASPSGTSSTISGSI
jgi:hypothetical protein